MLCKNWCSVKVDRQIKGRGWQMSAMGGHGGREGGRGVKQQQSGTL